MSWSHNVPVPVAGYAAGLSVVALQEIARRLPNLRLEPIAIEFSAYVVLRDTKQVDPESLKSEILGLLKTVRTLQKKLENLTPAAQHLIDQGAVLAIKNRVVHSLQDHLKSGKSGIARALEIAPTGRRLHPRTVLVLNLACLVREAGMEVDAKPTGPLVTLTGILLGAAHEDPSDVRKIVDETLSRWKLPPEGQANYSTIG